MSTRIYIGPREDMPHADYCIETEADVLVVGHETLTHCPVKVFCTNLEDQRLVQLICYWGDRGYIPARICLWNRHNNSFAWIDDEAALVAFARERA